MKKSTKWKIIGNIPFYILFGVWAIFMLVARAWEFFIFVLGAIIVFYFAYYLGKFCSKKEFEAEREEEEPKNYY